MLGWSFCGPSVVLLTLLQAETFVGIVYMLKPQKTPAQLKLVSAFSSSNCSKLEGSRNPLKYRGSCTGQLPSVLGTKSGIKHFCRHALLAPALAVYDWVCRLWQSC